MSRRKFSETDIIETLAWQGIYVHCFRCDEELCVTDGESVFWSGGPIEREHIHELKLGGPDAPFNCRYSHKDCHALVTNGTPATTAGSSKHRIAKTKGTRAEKFAVAKKPLDEPREKSSGFNKRPSRPFKRQEWNVRQIQEDL